MPPCSAHPVPRAAAVAAAVVEGVPDSDGALASVELEVVVVEVELTGVEVEADADADEDPDPGAGNSNVPPSQQSA